MAKFTLVGLDPELGLFAYLDAQSWQEAEARARSLGVGPVMVFAGVVPTADGRQPQDLNTWAEHYEFPVQQPFSQNPNFSP